MNTKYKKAFDKIADKLFDINQMAIKEKDDDAKDFSCYLIEIIESKFT